jgi:hypothetical protein
MIRFTGTRAGVGRSESPPNASASCRSTPTSSRVLADGGRFQTGVDGIEATPRKGHVPAPGVSLPGGTLDEQEVLVGPEHERDGGTRRGVAGDDLHAGWTSRSRRSRSSGIAGG